MRLIDADALRKSVLEWLPSDPCGRPEAEHPFETDICISMLQEIDDAPTIDAVPVARCENCIWHVCNYNKVDWDSAEPNIGRDCTDFVRWLMDEVMDEENWQMNAVANGEIICRKLKKLGVLDVVDGYYVKTQETADMRGEQDD